MSGLFERYYAEKIQSSLSGPMSTGWALFFVSQDLLHFPMRKNATRDAQPAEGHIAS